MLHLGTPGKQSIVRPCSTAGSLQISVISAVSATDSERHIPAEHATAMAQESVEKVYKVLRAEIKYQINIYIDHAL